MNYAWPAILQLFAFAVLFAEVLVPSFGVLSLIALGLGVWSWYFIVTELSGVAVAVFAIADAILVPLAVRQAFRYLGRSPVSHRTDVGVGSGLEETMRTLGARTGRDAIADSPLRPAGKIRIDGDLYEARTAGEFVQRGALVRIVAVQGAEYIVEPVRSGGA
jgi:membrane-bound serine protease (ClpP class)